MTGRQRLPSACSWLSTALALAFVLALAWFALRGLKRLQQCAAGGTEADAACRCCAAPRIGPRERLVAVRYRDWEYLLGVTAASVIRCMDQLARGRTRDRATAARLKPPGGIAANPSYGTHQLWPADGAIAFNARSKRCKVLATSGPELFDEPESDQPSHRE